MLSFATSEVTAPAVAAPPGFHAAVTAAGSGGGSESYVGIPFVGPRTGNRVLAWQVGAKYNISPDGVISIPKLSEWANGDWGQMAAREMDALVSYYRYSSDPWACGPRVPPVRYPNDYKLESLPSLPKTW